MTNESKKNLPQWALKVAERGGALVGYARVSSRGQDLTIQRDALTRVGVQEAHLYEEKVSGTRRQGREQLEQMLARGLRKNDCLVVTRLDRLARSTRDLLKISDQLEEMEADLVVLEQSINTSTAEGRLFFTMMGAFAEFEAELRKERQREGIAAALAKGADSPFKGRPATIKADEIERLSREGHGPSEIARQLNISRQSVYRVAQSSGLNLGAAS